MEIPSTIIEDEDKPFRGSMVYPDRSFLDDMWEREEDDIVKYDGHTWCMRKVTIKSKDRTWKAVAILRYEGTELIVETRYDLRKMELVQRRPESEDETLALIGYKEG